MLPFPCRTDAWPNPKSSRVLRIHLEYGVEQQYSMSIFTEVELQGSGNVMLPIFRCGDAVSREKGFVGIEAKTSVELSLVNVNNASVIDNSELESPLFKESQNPMPLAFKFLDPGFSVELSVIRHADVAVLIAVIEKVTIFAWVDDLHRELMNCHRLTLS